MHLRAFALVFATAALAACVVETQAPPRDANPASEMAPQGRDPGRIHGSTAEEDCRFAVATQVGVDQDAVRVRSATMGENFTTVLVDVPGAQAPWVCEWGGDGVSEVYYGAEG